MVESFLKNNTGSIQSTFEQGQNMLHVAAELGHIKLLQKLQSQYSNELIPLATDKSGNTLLHYSAIQGSWHNTEKLLFLYFKAGDLLTPNHKGETIVHLGAANKHLNFLHLLRKQQGDEPFKSVDKMENSVLHHACYHGAVVVSIWLNDTVKLSFAQKNRLGDTPLHVLAKHAIEDRQLWSAFEKIARTVDYALIDSYRNNQNETVKDILLRVNNTDILERLQPAALPSTRNI